METRRGSNRFFKILNGHENIDIHIFFKIKVGKRTRGHAFTLVKGQVAPGMDDIPMELWKATLEGVDISLIMRRHLTVLAIRSCGTRWSKWDSRSTLSNW